MKTTTPAPRPGPLSTIRGWMVAIALIAAVLATMILSPFVFIVAVFVLLEGVAFSRLGESMRRGPLSPLKQLLWTLTILVLVPIVSIAASFLSIYVYCTMNPTTLP